MGHRPPLSLTQLAAIWDAEPTPAVRELLWEIHRLQSTIRRAQQIRECCPTGATGVPPLVWDAFERELDAEPCLSGEHTTRQLARLGKMHASTNADRDKPRR